ncbi:efflux RND transporter permease subunit, partial [Escherichia coli]|uniref:efflux RND transporter permease subunit n=1 Tax=Escherichia coli TaxID=562 RepID=UPI003F272348
IVAEFNLDVASSVAAQDVRDKIAVAKANFRDEIEDPVVERYDPASRAIMSVVFETNSMSLSDFSSYIDQRILPQFRTLPGVG